MGAQMDYIWYFPACSQSKTRWKEAWCKWNVEDCQRKKIKFSGLWWREGFTSLVGWQCWEKIWGKQEAVDMDILRKNLVDWNIYMNIRKKSKNDKHLPGKLSRWIQHPPSPSLSPPFPSPLFCILFLPLSGSFDTFQFTADASSIRVCWHTPLIPSL